MRNGIRMARRADDCAEIPSLYLMNSPLEAVKPTAMSSTRYPDRSTAQAYSMATMWFTDMSSVRLLTMPSHCPLLWRPFTRTWPGLLVLEPAWVARPLGHLPAGDRVCRLRQHALHLCHGARIAEMSSVGLYSKDVKLRVLICYLSFSYIFNLNRFKNNYL
jgi:hypothetical protein